WGGRSRKAAVPVEPAEDQTVARATSPSGAVGPGRRRDVASHRRLAAASAILTHDIQGFHRLRNIYAVFSGRPTNRCGCRFPVPMGGFPHIVRASCFHFHPYHGACKVFPAFLTRLSIARQRAATSDEASTTGR